MTEVECAQWHDASVVVPHGRLLVLKTPHGVFLHSMLNRAGEIVPWDEQNDRYTDGHFDYEEVTHWVRLK